MKKTLLACLVLGSLAGLTACETTRYGDVRVHGPDYDVRVVFTDSDRRILRDHYRVDTRGLPPGLAKKGKIPPGHAYKMQRQHPLPPDVRWSYLPPDVERRLSRLPDGYARVLIGADIAILHTRTRVVVDLLDNIYD